MTSNEIEFVPSRYGTLLRGASPARLQELLNQFELLAKQLGAPVDAMNPGVDRELLDRAFASAGLAVSDELAAWFEWRNGSGAAWQALPGIVAASFEQALHRRTSLQGSPSEESAWGVPAGWIRLADDNYGLAIDATARLSDPPRLHFASPQFDEESVAGKMRATSLCTIVGWWIYGIETGGHRWDPSAGDWMTEVSLLHPTQRDEHFF